MLDYNNINSLIKRSPDILKYPLYLIPIGYRLGGKKFVKTYEFLKKSNSWNRNRLIDYQKKEIKSLLRYAVKNIPFYKEISLVGKNPIEDLERFPIIDKKTIQENLNLFINKDLLKNTYYVTTGGTSGNPLGFYLDKSTYAMEWAFVMTAWKRVGFLPGDKTISIRGGEFNKANRGIFWHLNPAYNMLEMSPFHLNKKNLPSYINKIIKYKPKFIHGYPSSITVLAKYCEDNSIKLPFIKAILAISENIFPEQRKFIEKIFDTRLFSFYGMSEKVIMAPECEFDYSYHLFPEYGYSELIDKNGNPVSEGQRGELVGTGFLNKCMPFIRYKTGDFAELKSYKCDKCNRNHMIVKNLIGRWEQEMIISKSHSLISIASLNLHGPAFKNTNRFQLIQKCEGELIIQVIPKKEFGLKDEKLILDLFERRVGNDLDLYIEKVNDIQLTQRGKAKMLIQKLNYNK